jgi:hypothetical protein
MSKQILYNGLKSTLETVTAQRAEPLDGSTAMSFKTIRLWRNDTERESEEIPFLLPACLIEFLPSNYSELSNQVQEYDMTVRLHIIFESYKDEDTDVLALVDATYAKVQATQYGFFGKMKRRNEEQNFDHTNWQDYIQDYDCGKVLDYSAQTNILTPLNDVDVTKV